VGAQGEAGAWGRRARGGSEEGGCEGGRHVGWWAGSIGGWLTGPLGPDDEPMGLSH
jgi:hypothetical protein